jgi:hypothetical protein
MKRSREDRHVRSRYAYLGSSIYAAAIAATLIAGAHTAFLIVLVAGGPITGLLYAYSGRGRRRE